jgi:hypothetical protein
MHSTTNYGSYNVQDPRLAAIRASILENDITYKDPTPDMIGDLMWEASSGTRPCTSCCTQCTPTCCLATLQPV